MTDDQTPVPASPLLRTVPTTTTKGRFSDHDTRLIDKAMRETGIELSSDMSLTELGDDEFIAMNRLRLTPPSIVTGDVRHTPFGLVTTDANGHDALLYNRLSTAAVRLHPDWVDGPPQHLFGWFLRHPVDGWRASRMRWYDSNDGFEMSMMAVPVSIAGGLAGELCIGVPTTFVWPAAIIGTIVGLIAWWLVLSVVATVRSSRTWRTNRQKLVYVLGPDTTVPTREVPEPVRQLGALMLAAGYAEEEVAEAVATDAELLTIAQRTLDDTTAADDQRRQACDAVALVTAHLRQVRDAALLATGDKHQALPTTHDNSQQLDDQARLAALLEHAPAEIGR